MNIILVVSRFGITLEQAFEDKELENFILKKKIMPLGEKDLAREMLRLGYVSSYYSSEIEEERLIAEEESERAFEASLIEHYRDQVDKLILERLVEHLEDNENLIYRNQYILCHDRSGALEFLVVTGATPEVYFTPQLGPENEMMIVEVTHYISERIQFALKCLEHKENAYRSEIEGTLTDARLMRLGLIK